MQFSATSLTSDEIALQSQVRTFLAGHLPAGSFRPGLGMNAPADASFSRQLAAHGWVGMALPVEYGGGERSAVERFVVTEELLAWGAPISHHWIGDRQSGSSIARFGTAEQKARFLPGICRGEIAFCIGMSEPEAGSDLAGVRMRAERADGGWLLTGTKVWTTGAHRAEWMVTLGRTSAEDDKRQGLTQFLVDLRAPGVEVRPIPFLDGTHDFNEVSLVQHFVADALVLGAVGEGWAQNTAELVLERSGPDRYLSTYPVVVQLLREVAHPGPELRAYLGRCAAGFWGFRNLALATARAVDDGRSPAAEAALVKEMATRFEQDVVTELLGLLDVQPSPQSTSLLEQLLHEATLAAPSFTIRGGTSEVLRSVAARGLTSEAPLSRDPVGDAAASMFRELCTPDDLLRSEGEGWDPRLWKAAAEMGLPWISVPEAAGGQGGTLQDAFAVLRAAGRYGVPLPLAETGVLGGRLLAAVGVPVPAGPITVAPGRPNDLVHWDGARPSGVLHQVPWARAAELTLMVVDDEVVVVRDVRVDPRVDVAGQPRDTVHLEGCDVVARGPVNAEELRRLAALTRVVLAAGALERVEQLSVSYAHAREQFGRPIARFQAVQQHLVHVAQQRALAGLAADHAIRAFAAGRGDVEISAARVLVGSATTIATRAAHQVHGAMGMTREYPLHHATRQLWAWAREYGSAEQWSSHLGDLVVEAGPEGLHPLITSGSWHEGVAPPDPVKSP